MFPIVFRSVNLECGYKSLGFCRERIASRNVLVIPLVINNFSIWVAQTQIAVCISADTILELVFFIWIETAEGNPPAVIVFVSLHSPFRHALPVVPVTDNVAITGVSSVVKGESNAVVSVVGDSVACALRHIFENHRLRNKRSILVLVIDNTVELVLRMTLD